MVPVRDGATPLDDATPSDGGNDAAIAIEDAAIEPDAGADETCPTDWCIVPGEPWELSIYAFDLSVEGRGAALS